MNITNTQHFPQHSPHFLQTHPNWQTAAGTICAQRSWPTECVSLTPDRGASAAATAPTCRFYSMAFVWPNWRCPSSERIRRNRLTADPMAALFGVEISKSMVMRNNTIYKTTLLAIRCPQPHSRSLHPGCFYKPGDDLFAGWGAGTEIAHAKN